MNFIPVQVSGNSLMYYTSCTCDSVSSDNLFYTICQFTVTNLLFISSNKGQLHNILRNCFSFLRKENAKNRSAHSVNTLFSWYIMRFVVQKLRDGPNFVTTVYF